MKRSLFAFVLCIALLLSRVTHAAEFLSILNPGAVSSDQTSAPISISGSGLVVIAVKVTVCTACSMRMWVETHTGDGVWFGWWAGTVTDHAATGDRYYLFSSTGKLDGISVGDMSGTGNVALTRPLPRYFRIRMAWTSGTTATYTVTGVAY